MDKSHKLRRARDTGLRKIKCRHKHDNSTESPNFVKFKYKIPHTVGYIGVCRYPCEIP